VVAQFGAIAVDDDLMVQGERFAETAVLTMPTGCICCKVRGDLVEGLKSLVTKVAAEKLHFDGLIVETSGLSEVAPLCQTFFADRYVHRNFVVDAVVCVVDALAAPAQLVEEESAATAAESSATVTAAVCGEAEAVLPAPEEPELEKAVEIRAEQGGASSEDESSEMSEVESSGGEEEEGALSVCQLLCEQLSMADVVLLSKQEAMIEAEKEALIARIQQINATASVLACVRGEVDLSKVLGLASFSVDSVLANPEWRPVVPSVAGQTWATNARFQPALSVGGDGGPMPRLHLHSSFGCLGLERASPVDELSFNDWIEATLREYGQTKLFRVKGILSFKGSTGKSALQCVRTHIEINRIPTYKKESHKSPPAGQREEASETGEEASEEPENTVSRIVFIGQTAQLEERLRGEFAAL